MLRAWEIIGNFQEYGGRGKRSDSPKANKTVKFAEKNIKCKPMTFNQL
jgi:hypothetical protein